MTLIRNINSVALIDASKIKFLNDEGQYEPITIEGLPFIPIYVCPIVKEDKETYELDYRLIIPSIKLTSTYTERYIKRDEQIDYESIPNPYLEDRPIIYDNENIHTMANIPKSKEITIDYISGKKRKVYEFAKTAANQVEKHTIKK